VGVVGEILKMVCAICFQFRKIKFLSDTLVHFCTYSGKSRLVYETTNEVRVFRRLLIEKSRKFPSRKHYKQRLDGRGFPVTIFPHKVNKMCVCVCVCVSVSVSRYSATYMWFSLYSKQLNTTTKWDRTGNV